MADQIEDASELSKIAKLNGDFRRNYGTLLGAFLILEVDQRRARSFCVLAALVSIASFAVLAWLWKHDFEWRSGG